MMSSENNSSLSILGSGFPAQVTDVGSSGDSPYLSLIGRRVCVEDGVVEGLTGVVVAVREPSRVVISVDADCQGCFVEIDGHSIAAVES